MSTWRLSSALGKSSQKFSPFLSPPPTSLVALSSFVKQTDLSRLITHFNCPSAAQLPAHLKRLHCFLLHKYLDLISRFLGGFLLVILPDDFPLTGYPWQPENVSDYEEAYVSSSHPCITSALDLNESSGRWNFKYLSCRHWQAIQGSGESQEAFLTFHWLWFKYIYIIIIRREGKKRNNWQ